MENRNVSKGGPRRDVKENFAFPLEKGERERSCISRAKALRGEGERRNSPRAKRDLDRVRIAVG